MKNKNIEMKIYELLGIKFFRKIAFKFRYLLYSFLNPKMSKEEKVEHLYNTASNYNLGKVKSLEDIKNFKTYLFINVTIHITALSACLPSVIKIIIGKSYLSTPAFIATLFSIVVNIYCIMLQRYNAIRINRVIKKMTPKYEKQKALIKEELQKENSLLLDHSYKIVSKKGKETYITFEDLIANANLEELKRYRYYLEYYKKVQQIKSIDESFNNNHQIDTGLPLENGKVLKLELTKQKYTN